MERGEKRRLPDESSTSSKKMNLDDTYLRSIPSASQYEKSFMHRDTVTHVLTTSQDFIITASQDGFLKIWKKKHGEGIEFVKAFRCHLKEFSDIALNHNGTLMATCSQHDKTVKVFDTVNADMINMVKLDFFPRVLCWLHTGSDIDNSLAIADVASPQIRIVDGKGSADEVVKVLDKLHTKPVVLMEYCAAVNVAISVDEIGMVEYWSGSKTNFEFPKNVSWEYKTDTDLYEFVKVKQVPKCLTISPNGQTFTVVSSDRSIYVFVLHLAKITRKFDESLSRYIQLGKENKCFGIPSMEWNRRIATEFEMDMNPNAFRFVKVIYDESSSLIIYPTPVGIMVRNIFTGEIFREIGTGENIRFMGLAVCRALPSASERFQGPFTSADIEDADNPNLKAFQPDPMLIASAYGGDRFYIFRSIEGLPSNRLSRDQDEGKHFSIELFRSESVSPSVEPTDFTEEILSHAYYILKGSTAKRAIIPLSKRVLVTFSHGYNSTFRVGDETTVYSPGGVPLSTATVVKLVREKDVLILLTTHDMEITDIYDSCLYETPRRGMHYTLVGYSAVYGGNNHPSLATGIIASDLTRRGHYLGTSGSFKGDSGGSCWSNGKKLIGMQIYTEKVPLASDGSAYATGGRCAIIPIDHIITLATEFLPPEKELPDGFFDE